MNLVNLELFTFGFIYRCVCKQYDYHELVLNDLNSIECHASKCFCNIVPPGYHYFKISLWRFYSIRLSIFTITIFFAQSSQWIHNLAQLSNIKPLLSVQTIHLDELGQIRFRLFSYCKTCWLNSISILLYKFIFKNSKFGPFCLFIRLNCKVGTTIRLRL